MFRDIKVLHLEPTDVCQAACPLCARETDIDFCKDRQRHLTIDQINKHFTDEIIAKLDKMFMCGNYGDPAAGKNTLEIYKHFRSVNTSIVLGMNTNGGLQNSFWWHALGLIMNQPQDYVVFSIDGLSDTNSVYRKNVNWAKLMSNAATFIAAGGSAHWDMLVYQHNQHQVDECEQLAREMGFKWFRTKVSRRTFTKTLQFPLGWQPIVMQDAAAIECHALKEQSVYVDAQGNLSPCCWLGSRQQNFVSDVDNIPTQDPLCLSICGKSKSGTAFDQQWQREVALC